MNVLILHRIPFPLMRYAAAIDHAAHEVYYVGTEQALADVPADLRCRRLRRDGTGPVWREVLAAIEGAGVRFDRVISLAEKELIDAARVRARLGLPGPTPEQVELVRNKVVMKRRVGAAGIEVPRFRRLDHWLAGRGLDLEPRAGVILKPVDGATAEDVRRFDDEPALAQALRRRASGSARLDRGRVAPAGFEVEEFVPGEVLHLDGFVHRGELKVLTGGRYLNTLLDYARGVPAGSVQIEITPAIGSWVARVIRAVEIERGAFHLEAIDSTRGLVFLEIAHRAGGARICETFERQTGIYLPCAAAANAIDESHLPSPRLDASYRYGWFIVPGHHLNARHCRLSGHRFLEGLDEVVALDELPPERELTRHVSYREDQVPLAGLLRSPDPNRIARIIERVFAEVRVEAAGAPPEHALRRAEA